MVRESGSAAPRPAVLTVINPSGNRSRVSISTVPFLIGRQAENQLVLRDNRISRAHARIVAEGPGYVLEDLDSRHGTFVNGQRIHRHALANSDLVEFGFPDSFKLTFGFEDDDIGRILRQIQAPSDASTAPGTSNLGKLRALVEVARALQSSLSTHDVLTAVVDAALAVTNAERGFLLLKKADDLDISVARDRQGMPLAPTELTVPMSVIHRALRQRRELLSMSFDPVEEQGLRPETSIANLELRSVVCVPLIRVRNNNSEETSMLTSSDSTVGLLYMDSRAGHADLSHGNRELLQTLALEASTILENARLLEEERVKQRLEEELDIARQIQAGLMPPELPGTGWFRVAASTTPSRQVGGDYFDVRRIAPETWCIVVADVSGKGVSSALLASLLQGAFLQASDNPAEMQQMLLNVNRYLLERTKGEKYATLFFSTLRPDGTMHWSNAGHCAPLVVSADGGMRELDTSGLPLGMLEFASYKIESSALKPGDKLVIYSDGVTEAQNAAGAFLGLRRVREVLAATAARTCAEMHAAVLAAIDQHAHGALQADDITLVICEYQPGT